MLVRAAAEARKGYFIRGQSVAGTLSRSLARDPAIKERLHATMEDPKVVKDVVKEAAGMLFGFFDGNREMVAQVLADWNSGKGNVLELAIEHARNNPAAVKAEYRELITHIDSWKKDLPPGPVKP